MYATPEAAAEAAARQARGTVETLYQWSPDHYRVRIRFTPGPDGEPRKSFRPVSRNGAGWLLQDPPKPYAPYRLASLPAEGVLYVAEGEKAAEAGWSVGLSCTTSGAADSAGSVDWSPLAGRQVTLLPDADEPGRKYARDVARRLLTLSPPAVVRIVELPGLPPKGDAYEFVHELRDGRSGDEIRAEIEALAAAVEPEKLEAPTAAPEWRPFPAEALPETVRRFALAAAACTSTDVSWAALGCLAILAGCIGNRRAAIVGDGWAEVAVLWVALVGRSGTMKSPLLKLLTRPLVELRKEARAAYAEAHSEYEAAAARHEAAIGRWKRQAQRVSTPEDPPAAPTPPAEHRTVVQDITVEKLASVLSENPKGLLLIRDELAAWLGSFDQYRASGRGSDTPTWLSMHDADTISVDRKISGSVFVERAAVSLLGGIQPAVLVRAFGRGQRENGLLARLLLSNPPERAALFGNGRLPQDVLDGWAKLLRAVLDIEPDADEQGNPRPRYLPLSTEGKRLFVQWHDAHARELVDTEGNDLRAYLSKLRGGTVRLALVLAVAEAASNGHAPPNIDARAVQRAIQIVRWLVHEGRRVYELFGESDGDREQRMLTEWIQRRGGRVAVRELQQHVRRFRGDTDAAEQALAALVAAGLGRWEPVPGRPGGGPSSRVFVLCVSETHENHVENDSSGGGDKVSTANWDPWPEPSGASGEPEAEPVGVSETPETKAESVGFVGGDKASEPNPEGEPRVAGIDPKSQPEPEAVSAVSETDEFQAENCGSGGGGSGDKTKSETDAPAEHASEPVLTEAPEGVMYADWGDL